MIIFNSQILIEQYNHIANKQTETKWNKLDFKGHPQKNPKIHKWPKLIQWGPIMILNCLQKINSKGRAVLEIFTLKNQSIWLTERILWQNWWTRWLNYLKWLNQFTVYMNVYPHASQLNSALIYCRFNIGNYFWHAQKCLKTPMKGLNQ